MSYTTQILMFLLTLIGAPLGVKLLDLTLVTFKAWWNRRRDSLVTQSQNDQELQKLRMMKDIDVSKIKRDDFQTVTDGYAKIAEASTKRAHEAEAHNGRLLERVEELERKFDATADEVKCCLIIREQMEADERLMYDTFNIAYWEMTPDGKVFGNATFLKLTGLPMSGCHNNGWFEAIDETTRHRCRNFWEAFVENHHTRPAITFTFRNVQTLEQTETMVFCGARMRNITEVYKYTARTKPLPAGAGNGAPTALPNEFTPRQLTS